MPKLFNKLALTAVVATIGLSAPAAAQDADQGRFRIAITGGTLGIGPEIGYRINKVIGVRANATFFNFGADVDVDDITYNGKLKLNSFGAMVDIHPFSGGFRISGGARISNNRVGVSATPTSPVEVGDVIYTVAQIGTLSGTVKAKDFAPTATIGWGGNLGKGFNIAADIGAMFQGSPRIADLTATGSLANDPAFRTQLQREQTRISDEINNFKVYPIVQVSIGYRF